MKCDPLQMFDAQVENIKDSSPRTRNQNLCIRYFTLYKRITSSFLFALQPGGLIIPSDQSAPNNFYLMWESFLHDLPNQAAAAVGGGGGGEKEPRGPLVGICCYSSFFLWALRPHCTAPFEPRTGVFLCPFSQLVG